MGEDGGEYAALPRNSAVGPLVTNRSVSCHAMPASCWCAAFAFTRLASERLAEGDMKDL